MNCEEIKAMELPGYTRGEEIMNMVSHIVGGAVGIAVTVFGVLFSAWRKDPWGIVGAAIYGFTMIWLYTMSSVYHGLRPGKAKMVMRVLDHCTIYALIAGTYTPILLAGVRPVYPVTAWVCFGIEWALLALTTTLTAVDLKKYGVFSMICYIAMGWLVVFIAPKVIDVMSVRGFLWLLFGGIAYSIGAVLYGIGKKKRWFHSIFHFFVLTGSLMQAVAILFYILK